LSRPAPTLRTTAVGSGAVVLTSVSACNAAGSPTFVYDHGAPFTLRVGYRINDPSVAAPQAIVVFHRDGVEDVCRLFCGDLALEARPYGEIVISLPRLALGEGQYTVSVAVTEPGYYDRQQTVFFSINPGMFDCWIRALEFRVTRGGVVGTGTAVVLDAVWKVCDSTVVHR
jgi:hypothetical protein